MPIVVRANNFTSEVLEAKGPVLVDFYGEHCIPCRLLRPILLELSEEYAGIKLCVFNTDQEPRESDEEYEEKYSIFAAYGVMNLPTMLLFLNGVVVLTLVGLHTKEELLQIFTEQGLALQPVQRDEQHPAQAEDS